MNGLGTFLEKHRWLRGLRKLPSLAVYVLLILISYQFLYPLLRMLTLALMSAEDVVNPTVNWLPKSWTFQNIRVAAHVLDVGKTLLNTLLFCGALAVGQTLVSALTGFAQARYNFKLKRLWFVMILVSFIIPTPVVIIPRSMFFGAVQDLTKIQMIGTPIPQLAMTLLGQGIYSAILILIFYNFTKMIPKSLDEAAAIDGAGPLRVFYHIILKLSLPTILVVFLFSLVWNWNETYQTSTFLRGKIALMPERLRMFDSLFANFSATAPAGSAQSRINEAYKMSATFLTVLPLLGIYVFVQKHFIKGIESAGITGE
jgi:multiple sugar transport system permease protein